MWTSMVVSFGVAVPAANGSVLVTRSAGGLGRNVPSVPTTAPFSAADGPAQRSGFESLQVQDVGEPPCWVILPPTPVPISTQTEKSMLPLPSVSNSAHASPVLAPGQVMLSQPHSSL